MFNRQKTDPKITITQMSSLSVAWGIVAAIAYLGLIKVAVDFVANVTPWEGAELDPGLLHLNADRSAHFISGISDFITPVVAALPVVIILVVLFGIIIRVRPALAPGLSIGIIIASVLGLIGALLFFLAQVATRAQATQFIVALVTIVLVAVLLRLQRFIRRFYGRSPAVASLIFAIVTIVYLILANGVNITSIVLTQADIWLAIIAFAITLYAGFRIARAARKAS